MWENEERVTRFLLLTVPTWHTSVKSAIFTGKSIIFLTYNCAWRVHTTCIKFLAWLFGEHLGCVAKLECSDAVQRSEPKLPVKMAWIRNYLFPVSVFSLYSPYKCTLPVHTKTQESLALMGRYNTGCRPSNTQKCCHLFILWQQTITQFKVNTFQSFVMLVSFYPKVHINDSDTKVNEQFCFNPKSILRIRLWCQYQLAWKLLPFEMIINLPNPSRKT